MVDWRMRGTDEELQRAPVAAGFGHLRPFNRSFRVAACEPKDETAGAVVGLRLSSGGR
jgi:hypothetical protein